MASKLNWNKVKEVSVVDAGANLKGRFPITKSKGKAMDMKELIEAALETPVEGEAAIEKRGDSDEEKQALVALVRVADAIGIDKSIFNLDDDSDDDLTDDDNVSFRDTPVEKFEESQREDDMNDEIKKQFEDLQKRLDDEKTAREAVEKQLQDARDEQALAGWVAKAKDNLSHVPGQSVEDMAKSLFDLAKVNPEMADAQYATLCNASAALAKSETFKAVGTSGRTETDSEARIAKRADELKKNGMNPADAFRAAAIEAEKQG